MKRKPGGEAASKDEDLSRFEDEGGPPAPKPTADMGPASPDELDAELDATPRYGHGDRPIERQPVRDDRSAAWEQIVESWHEFKSRVKHKWNQLTERELDRIHGDRDNLIATLQQRTGASRPEIERELDALVHQHAQGDLIDGPSRRKPLGPLDVGDQGSPRRRDDPGRRPDGGEWS